MIEDARNSITNERDKRFADAALTCAYDAGIFQECTTLSTPKELARKAETTEMEKIKLWEKQLKETTKSQMEAMGIVDLTMEVTPGIAGGTATIQDVHPSIESQGEQSHPHQQSQRRPMLAQT